MMTVSVPERATGRWNTQAFRAATSYRMIAASMRSAPWTFQRAPFEELALQAGQLREQLHRCLPLLFRAERRTGVVG